VSDLAQWVFIVGGSISAVFLTVVVVAQAYYRFRYLDQVVRIFEEKPLFIVPKGKPVPGAEDVHFPTPDGFTLRGCYLRGHRPRRGVILFGPEFGSNRWACLQYTSALLDAGYDVFSFEPRNQGESDTDPAYRPLQWVTDRDQNDLRAAVAYLKKRKDAPAAGVGLFGISKGGSVGLLAAAGDPWVRCVATDGAYATYTTMVPYMRKWVHLYIKSAKRLRAAIPDWFYGLIGLAAVRTAAGRRGVTFLNLERALSRYRKPLLMIHGQADTYIKPEMAQALFDRAATPDAAKELWLVDKAKHNQALAVAAADYHRKLTAFFDAHLAADGDSGVLPPAPPSGRLAKVAG
jgi:pimeloyl-ACP methyl ester carboxylesterase